MSEILENEREETSETDWVPSLVLLFITFILNTFLQLNEIFLHSWKFMRKVQKLTK